MLHPGVASSWHWYEETCTVHASNASSKSTDHNIKMLTQGSVCNTRQTLMRSRCTSPCETLFSLGNFDWRLGKDNGD